MDAVELALFIARTQAVCDEMGAVLRRTALSPNIKDRLDYSCALFDRSGALFAQAAHIPVHLGSMAFAMADLVRRFDWCPGDVVMLNDPFLGGTHLPDVTVIAPAFDAEGVLLGFAADRAHHANIGADRPGSMPLSSTLEEEGVLIPPMLLLREGRLPPEARRVFYALGAQATAQDAVTDWQRDPVLADFAAQVSSARIGARLMTELASTAGGPADFRAAIARLNAWAARLAQSSFAKLPAGRFSAEDALDGAPGAPIPIAVALSVDHGPKGTTVVVDFTGTAAQQPDSNLNCPLPVAAAAVFYALRALMPAGTPAVAGAFEAVEIRAPKACLVNAQRAAAVTAGNVETSMRVVDAVLRALADACPDAIPAAAQGTMNNIAMGQRGAHEWDYYETLAGGHGGHACGPGLSARHAHMTNTLNTPVESLETHYPLRIERYALRRGSGGTGVHRGGDGIERSYRFLESAEVTLLTERRRSGPWGLLGGAEGAPGAQFLNGESVGGRAELTVKAGDLLMVCTPGGGGWGAAKETD